MTDPDISILMTALNAEKFLREAVASILQQQTKHTWELVFVDDGSTDRTLAIIEEFAGRLPGRLCILRHPVGENRGISASRNLALCHARGALVAFLDADDVWLPHHLETLTELLATRPQAAMVYAAAERWVDFDRPFEDARARKATWGRNYLPPLVPEGERGGLLPRGRLLQWFQADESLVPCICAVIVRAEAARAVHGFCEAFRGLYDDQAFHAKMSLQYDIYVQDVCVARYRQHRDSCCGRSRVDERSVAREHRRFQAFVAACLRTTTDVKRTRVSYLSTRRSRDNP